ncbi:hypothetical protein K2Q00_00040 [Patescibacteria group bacterium]|nr:hypothetical protein [Patescibacteria group bacterium]
MSQGVCLHVFGKEFPIVNPRVRRIKGNDFEVSGSFKGQFALYRRISMIWVNSEGRAIDPMFGAFFDIVVEEFARYMPA